MAVIKRSNLIIFTALVLSFITLAICIGAFSVKPINQTTASAIKIVVDAGHGGIDGGVCGINSGIKESELNLDVTKKLQNYLVSAGFGVVLTRNSEAGLYGTAVGNLKKKDMKKRREIILDSNPNLVVSIHMNKFSNSSRRGAQTFYKEGDENGKKLADSIQDSFNEMSDTGRKYTALSGDYYILNCTEIPSVIAECGFLSNPDDEALLLKEEYRSEIAYALFKGIISYLSQRSMAFCD